MTIALDSTSTGYQGYGSNITQTHTVGAGLANSILIAMVGDNTATDIISTVTFAGQPMTRGYFHPSADGSYSAGYFYYLLNPPAGPGSLVVTFNNATTAATCAAASFSGVLQSAPISATAGTTSNFNPTTMTQAIATPAGGIALSLISSQTQLTLTDDASQTTIAIANNTGTSFIGAAFKADATAMTWTSTAASQPYSHSVISLSPAAGAAPPPATVTSVSVTPATATVAGTATQQFAATVNGTNSPSQAVTWSTNIGSITASGLYTAPAQTGAVQTATITATSTADNTKAGTASVTIPANAATTTSFTPPHPFVSIGGSLRTNETGARVAIYDMATDALVARKTGLTTDANGNMAAFTVSGPVANTQYRCITVFSDGAEGIELITAV